MDATREFYIKGMVCQRCVAVIRDGLTALGYPVEKVTLGKVVLQKATDKVSQQNVEKFLTEKGFHLVSDRRAILIKNIKTIVGEIFFKSVRDDVKVKFSVLLSESLNMSYDAISDAFSQAEGMTLEHYIIVKRLEKVKELLVYTEFNLTDIAYITGFSSVNHLSRQFKELTGLPPSHFMKIRVEKKRVVANKEMM
ncbi:MAG: helix-turn-helix domain-containing protein [Cyclobacteriaceae bacterium]